MEIFVSLDEEPFERILEVEGVVHGGSEPQTNYGLDRLGEPPTFEPTSIEWSEDDPLVESGEDPGDPVTFYEAFEGYVDEEYLREHARSQFR